MSEQETVPAAEVKNETKAPAGDRKEGKRTQEKEDFNSYSDEKLREIIDTPVERAQDPAKLQFDEKMKAIDKQIDALKKEQESCRAIIDLAIAGINLRKSEKSSSIEISKGVQAKKVALLDERKKLNEILKAKFKLLEEANAQKNTLGGGRSAEELERMIEKKEDAYQAGTFTAREEKEMEKEISVLKKQLAQSQQVGTVKSSIESIRKEIAETKAKLEVNQKAVNEMFEQLGLIRQSTDQVDKEKEGKPDVIKENKEKIAEISKQIKAKYEEKNVVFQEMIKAREAFFVCKQASGRQNVAKAVLRNRERAAEEEILKKKEEEELLKQHPFEYQMQMCDIVISYLKGLARTSRPVAATSASDETKRVAPEGMVLMTRDEENPFDEIALKKKAPKKKPAAKKPQSIIHSLDTLSAFNTVHLNPPMTNEEVKEILETAIKRKEFFNGLPRGANVAEELKKVATA